MTIDLINTPLWLKCPFKWTLNIAINDKSKQEINNQSCRNCAENNGVNLPPFSAGRCLGVEVKDREYTLLPVPDSGICLTASHKIMRRKVGYDWSPGIHSLYTSQVRLQYEIS